MLLEPNAEGNFTRDEWLAHLELINKNRDKAGLKRISEKSALFKSKIKSKQEVINQVIQLYWEKKFQEATEICVQYLKSKYYFKSIEQDEKREIWYYNEGIYLPNGVSKIKEELRDLFDDKFSRTQVNNVVDKIEADTFIKSEEFFNQQNKEPYLIPVENGILNVKTKELQSFNKELYFFNKLPVEYKEKAKCPNIVKFIKEITTKKGIEQKDAIDSVQELIGYCLVKNYKYQKAFMLEGKKGSNGKSVLCSLIKLFLNQDNVSSINITALDKIDGFALAGLHNKLVNISAEISKEALDNKGFFKQLTGDDTISANRKNKTYIHFTNYAKLIFTANELPIPKNADEGFWRRWVRIEFPNKYLSKKEYSYLDEQEKKECFLKDKDLIDKITSQEELNGLLIWVLHGLKRLENKGDFSIQKSIQENRVEWERKTNSILCFCQDHIKQDYDNFIIKEELRREYSIYCKTHKVKPMSDKAIKIHLENDLFAEDSQRTVANVNNSHNNQVQSQFSSERVRVWKGVSFINKPSKKGVAAQGTHQTQGVSLHTKDSLCHIGGEKPCAGCERCAPDKNNNIFHLLNSMIREVKYDFVELQNFIEIEDEELENLLKKMIFAGDLMIVEGKYMLVN